MFLALDTMPFRLLAVDSVLGCICGLLGPPVRGILVPFSRSGASEVDDDEAGDSSASPPPPSTPSSSRNRLGSLLGGGARMAGPRPKKAVSSSGDS